MELNPRWNRPLAGIGIRRIDSLPGSICLLRQPPRIPIPRPEQVSQEHGDLEKDQEDSAEQQQVQKGIDGVDQISVLHDIQLGHDRLPRYAAGRRATARP